MGVDYGIVTGYGFSLSFDEAEAARETMYQRAVETNSFSEFSAFEPIGSIEMESLVSAFARSFGIHAVMVGSVYEYGEEHWLIGTSIVCCDIDYADNWLTRIDDGNVSDEQSKAIADAKEYLGIASPTAFYAGVAIY